MLINYYIYRNLTLLLTSIIKFSGANRFTILPRLLSFPFIIPLPGLTASNTEKSNKQFLSLSHVPCRQISHASPSRATAPSFSIAENFRYVHSPINSDPCRPKYSSFISRLINVFQELIVLVERKFLNPGKLYETKERSSREKGA